jgi:hypothetical protein
MTSSCAFLVYSSTLKMEVTCSSKTFVDIHGVVSQKTELIEINEEYF